MFNSNFISDSLGSLCFNLTMTLRLNFRKGPLRISDKSRLFKQFRVQNFRVSVQPEAIFKQTCSRMHCIKPFHGNARRFSGCFAVGSEYWNRRPYPDAKQEREGKHRLPVTKENWGWGRKLS